MIDDWLDDRWIVELNLSQKWGSNVVALSLFLRPWLVVPPGSSPWTHSEWGSPSWSGSGQEQFVCKNCPTVPCLNFFYSVWFRRCTSRIFQSSACMPTLYNSLWKSRIIRVCAGEGRIYPRKRSSVDPSLKKNKNRTLHEALRGGWNGNGTAAPLPHHPPSPL